MEFEREYGVACTVEVPMIKLASDDFAGGSDWTPASGDTKISKDGGAAADLGSNPATLTMGNGATWKFSLTAAEMQAARIAVSVIDATSGKAVKDQQINIRTYGHPSAADPRDVEVYGTASACTTTTVTLPASSDFGANFYPGKRVQVKGTTAGTQPQDRQIVSTSYASGAYTATFDRALDVAPTGTITVKVWRQIGPVVAASVDANGRIDLGKINGDATAAANLAKTTRAIGRGTVTTGASATSVTTSAFTPAGATSDTNQFKGRIITFDADTTTEKLRGQATDITGNTSGATPTFTVSTLTATPQDGDTFSVT